VAAGGQTEEEKIHEDILENQLMDVSNDLARVCYSPDFVSFFYCPSSPGFGIRCQYSQILIYVGLVLLAHSFFFLVVLGFELRAFQLLYHLSHSISLLLNLELLVLQDVSCVCHQCPS
jgi:hypothetical protein